MNIGNYIYRLVIDLVDEADMEHYPNDVAGFFYYRTEQGGLEKQYYHSNHRRLLKTMSEEEVEFIKTALNREGYNVESFTVFHSPSNSFTYRKAFEKSALHH